MEDLSFDAACAYLDTVTVPHSRTGNAIARLAAEVALCREAARNLANAGHDLLVLLDDSDPPVTRDERVGHAIDRLDQLVARVRLAPGGAGAAPPDKTIRK